MSKPSSYNKGETYVGGNLTVKGATAITGALTVTGLIRSTSTSAPTAAAGTNAGTSPPAPVVAANSNDTAGKITWGSGSGSPAAGDYADVTFGTAFAATPRSVTLTPLNSATSAKAPLYVTSLATTGFSINMQTAGGTSQANTVYGCYYTVHPA